MGTEKRKLDLIASNSLYADKVNSQMIKFCFNIFFRHLVPGSVLELGPAEGLMTEKLYLYTEDLTIVDGSKIFCNRLKIKFPKSKVENVLFEEFSPTRKFDNIILGHVLEHVEDPVSLLRKCKDWLTSSGKIMAAVPNSQSIHRQAAVIMGLLEKEDAMSELDIHHGHRRVYCPSTFKSDFRNAGLDILQYGGFWLKPVSNSQIEESWSESMLNAFLSLGEKYPDIAAEIYIVAK